MAGIGKWNYPGEALRSESVAASVSHRSDHGGALDHGCTSDDGSSSEPS